MYQSKVGLSSLRTVGGSDRTSISATSVVEYMISELQDSPAVWRRLQLRTCACSEDEHAFHVLACKNIDINEDTALVTTTAIAY